VGQFLQNLAFSVDMENVLMAAILDDGEDPEDAAADWLRENMDILDTWLAGVTTIEGGEAVAAVTAALAE
jgi:glycine betaine/proline transport system substrate-binding protein